MTLKELKDVKVDTDTALGWLDVVILFLQKHDGDSGQIGHLQNAKNSIEIALKEMRERICNF